jgi:hypothetical protein
MNPKWPKTELHLIRYFLPDKNIVLYTPRGIFGTERVGMPFRKFLLRRMQARMAFQNLFPGIGTINTSLSD